MFEKKTKVLNSTALEKEVNGIMSVFTDTVSKLKVVSDNALTEKSNKEEEIKNLQKEADALNAVSEKALSFVDKIEKLFN